MTVDSHIFAVDWEKNGNIQADSFATPTYYYNGNCYILEPNFAPDPDGKSDYGNPYLFTGRRVDILDNGSLKLQYNRTRYYDYHSGRWFTQDMLGYIDGMNLYEYCGTQPITHFDSLGLFIIEPILKPMWKQGGHGCFDGAWMSIALFPTKKERSFLLGHGGDGTVIQRKYALWQTKDCCGNRLDKYSGTEVVTFINPFELDKGLSRASPGMIATGEWVDGKWIVYQKRWAIAYVALIAKEFYTECCTQGSIQVTAQFLMYANKPVFPPGETPITSPWPPSREGIISWPEYGHDMAWFAKWMPVPSGTLVSKGAIKVQINWDWCEEGHQTISIWTHPDSPYVTTSKGFNTRIGREADSLHQPGWYPFDYF